MAFEVKVLADSISPDGVRLTTFQRTYPHAVHKDMLRHRQVFSYQSLRAFPTEVLFQKLEQDPFIPDQFQEYGKGMSVGGAVAQATEELCREAWLEALDAAMKAAKTLIDAGVNKGHSNILIQDFTWITGIVTATEWSNFFALRAHPPGDSKPRAEVMKIAGMQYDAMMASTPKLLDYGEPHLPLIRPEDWVDAPGEDRTAKEWALIQACTGKCARSSYLTHDGLRDLAKDMGLHDSLLTARHMSPFDHPAWPIPLTEPKYVEKPDPRVGTVIERGNDWRGSLYGFCGYRKTIPMEYDFGLARGLAYGGLL